MIYLIILVALLTLLAGFMLLTAFETKTGRRALGRLRERLDARTARTSFIIRHVDWAGFTKHSLRTGLEWVAHEIAHGILLLVRFLERSLTRIVRGLRERRGHAALRERPTLRETVQRFRRSVSARRQRPQAMPEEEE